jgi:hypothetical protein
LSTKKIVSSAYCRLTTPLDTKISPNPLINPTLAAFCNVLDNTSTTKLNNRGIGDPSA